MMIRLMLLLSLFVLGAACGDREDSTTSTDETYTTSTGGEEEEDDPPEPDYEDPQ